MDWNVFFAVITWAVAVVCVIIAIFAGCVLERDDLSAKGRYNAVITFLLSIAATTLAAAIIAGMGWA